MITIGRDPLVLVAAPEGANCLGEASEVAEMSRDLLVEARNLEVAMEVMRHRASLSEDAQPGRLQALKDFAAKTVAKIKEFWAKFLAWLRGARKRIVEEVFKPRLEWIEEHEAELRAKKDFGGATHPYPSKAFANNAGGIASIIESIEWGAKKSIYLALNEKNRSSGFREYLLKVIWENHARTYHGDSFAKLYSEIYLGETVEEEITGSSVARVIGIAKECFKAIDQIGKMDHFAQAAAGAAANIGSSQDKSEEERLRHLSMAGPTVAGMISAGLNVVTQISAVSMAFLVKARSAGPKKDG